MIVARLVVVVVTILVAAPVHASTADDICAPNADPCVVSSAKPVAGGSTLDFGTRQLDVKAGGSLTVSGGLMTIKAGGVRLESGGDLIGADTGGNGASIRVETSGDIRTETGGNGDATISVSATDNPGNVDLVAHGNIVIGGQVSSDASSNPGSGGIINVTADGTVSVTGSVSARGGVMGLGGAVTIMGATASVTGPVKADGGDGGDIEVDSLNGDLTQNGTMDSSAGGTYGDGGTVTLNATQSLSVAGTLVLPGTGNFIDGGGDGGDVDLEGTAGNLSVTGTVDNHGASPDGDAGETDVTAGADYTQSGTLADYSAGGDGCGGFVDIEVGRNVSVSGDIDMSGGYCGGDLIAYATSASFASTCQFSADAGQLGGTFTVNAESITVAGKVHAVATDTGGENGPGTGGQIQLTGCTLNVPSGAVVKTDGAAAICTCFPDGPNATECGSTGYCSNGVCVGGDLAHLQCTSSSQCAPTRTCASPAINLLQASGQLTIGGQLSSRPLGHNRFEYRDPTKPPSVSGSASVQPARDCAPLPGCLTPSLLPCAQAAVCGNGTQEPGEQCDDGNVQRCDGCSSTCQREVCGNGTIDCGEDCDDGSANGAPGDPCDATCHIVQGGNTIYVPSAHRGARGCWLEWALRHEPIAGFPSTSITCIDGDTCDADGANDGVCTFQASACLNVTDPRLPLCKPAAVETIKARRPSPTRPSDDVERQNAEPFVSALETLGPTVKSGDTVLYSGTPDSRADHCTAQFDIRVPHAPGSSGRRALSAGVKDTLGDRASDRITLTCLPNNAVCGNGRIEAGEQCDDGNTTCGDGCSEHCKIERCGDGIVDCNEQCDDGANNGTSGDRCTASCTEAPPADRIPGGSSSRDCISEFSLAWGQLATKSNGAYASKQVCVDGDPSCDFDPTAGSCRFHLWQCFAGADARLGCAADAVASEVLIRPSASQTGFFAAARTVVDAALARLGFPVGPGELCTERMDLDVPAGRTKLLVKTEATTVDGIRDRDALKLTCAPAGTSLRQRR